MTAITNFLLASLPLLLCGLHLQHPKDWASASWYWGCALLFMALAALLGCIDRGFLEPRGLPRDWIRQLTWWTVGLANFFVVQTGIAEFLGGGLRRAISCIAHVQLLAFSAAVLVVETHLLVVLSYAPAMLLLLLLSVVHGGRERGSPLMIASVRVSRARAKDSHALSQRVLQV